MNTVLTIAGQEVQGEVINLIQKLLKRHAELVSASLSFTHYAQ